ncbi:MAG: SbcC/MukB-like Walker B domain-containing protein, partial [Solirubrobacterales bacterium]
REIERKGAEPTIGARLAVVDAGIESLVEAAEANKVRASTEAEKVRIGGRVDKAAEKAGFATSKDAAAASLDSEKIEELDRELKKHDEALAKCRGLLEKGALAKVDSATEIDLKSISEEASKQGDAAIKAESEFRSVEKTIADFTKETDPLPDLLKDLEPIAEKARISNNLSDLASGRGNNELSMPLSTYVLAARLEEVIEAANRHLISMSGDRYSLAFSDEREGREHLTGLGIRIEDSWTGEQRGTRSLSGGESFFTSLALALGLAEVVQLESGASELETLFIDEGFGSLDDSTLEKVMTRLDTLRERGRVVGLVSHVEELKENVDAQLVVSKTPSGSTLSLSGV